ncbi:GrpB family protein [Methylomonas sp. SURF-1]|uniref:GrpB family protein n=1 Tax=Methylomonas aurea TaxID=2952224 RepID=A0ABT1UE11_9GAMM|nr:GrpB family protein [Methylomonas sp. SURF-1]MCQ8180472.1 GrpB family protein [Methylomonas sp. SURF-1]
MKVALVPYQYRWQDDFARHRQAIEKALSDFVPDVEHIGSTSLGDIAAKPIIDILVGLQDEQSLDAAVIPLLDAGYTYIEKFNAGMPYRRFFVALVALKDIPLPRILGDKDELAFGREYDSVANIHVMTRGSYHWIRHLAFRDYLRTHPEVRKSYEALKLKIAEIDFADPLEYNSHKEDFIAEQQEKAVAWFVRVHGIEIQDRLA